MLLRPYPKYQSSDAAGAPQLPSHWCSKRLRYISRINPSKSEINLEPDAPVSFIPMEAVGEHGGLQLTTEKPLDEIGSGYTYFADNDVIVAKITPCFENGKGALAEDLTNGVAFGTTELHVIRAGAELEPRFLFYISISAHFRGIGGSEMYGAGGQKRVAVMTHAVTKGLDPTVPLKDSGIDWLGRIPTHWDVKKLKYTVCHVVDCVHTTPHYDGDLRYPAVRTADLERGRLLLEQVRLVSEEVYQERIQRLRPLAGDILYSREGERFGMAALVPHGVDLCLGQRTMMFRSLPNCASQYLMWALNSEAIYQQVILYTGGATSPHINISDIINFHVPCPPHDEQLRIAEHIEHECSQLDWVSTKLRDGIVKIQEYRSALITSAVTGKIDVRGMAESEVAA